MQRNTLPLLDAMGLIDTKATIFWRSQIPMPWNRFSDIIRTSWCSPIFTWSIAFSPCYNCPRTCALMPLGMMHAFWSNIKEDNRLITIVTEDLLGLFCSRSLSIYSIYHIGSWMTHLVKDFSLCLKVVSQIFSGFRDNHVRFCVAMIGQTCLYGLIEGLHNITHPMCTLTKR